MTPDKTKELWVIEWSNSQGCWHIETIEEMQKRNLDLFLTKEVVDYVPLMITGSHDEAHDMIDLLDERMKQTKGENWQEKYWD